MAQFRRGDILVVTDNDDGRWTFASGPSFPTGVDGIPPPPDGAIFMRTDENTQYAWDEATGDWIAIGGGGGGPDDAEYAVAAPHGSLSAERVLTDTATVTWDLGTPGQIKADAVAAPATTQVWTVNTPAEITANTHNYNPGTETVQRISSDANRDITGLLAEADGTVKRLVNVGSFTIRLMHQNVGSDAANRFICAGAANISLPPGAEALCWCDAASGGWRSALV